VAQSVIAELPQKIEKHRPEDTVVAVSDLGRRLNDPERIVRVAGQVLEKRPAGIRTLPPGF
jgi:hypothetical protein